MSAAHWPETVAAGISLIEVALGPEIAEEAFNIVMGMDTFEAACRRADAKVKRDEHNERLRALLCDDVSFVSAWTLIQKRHATCQVTIEALWQSIKENGVEALTDPANQERLRRCDAAAIAEINRRIAKLTKSRPYEHEILRPRPALGCRSQDRQGTKHSRSSHSIRTPKSRAGG